MNGSPSGSSQGSPKAADLVIRGMEKMQKDYEATRKLLAEQRHEMQRQEDQRQQQEERRRLDELLWREDHDRRYRQLAGSVAKLQEGWQRQQQQQQQQQQKQQPQQQRLVASHGRVPEGFKICDMCGAGMKALYLYEHKKLRCPNRNRSR